MTETTRLLAALALALASGAAWGQTPPDCSKPQTDPFMRAYCANSSTYRLYGDGEFVVPPNTSALEVTLIGAGGNGSKDGTPGGRGAMKQFMQPVISPGERYTYSVGQPGEAGKPGGSSRFGDMIAYGGGSQAAGDGAKGMPGTILVLPIPKVQYTDWLTKPPAGATILATCERLSPEAIAQLQPRHYTPAEIDRMRAAVIKRIGTKSSGGGMQFTTYSPTEVEDRLRTYIAAGVTPEELER